MVKRPHDDKRSRALVFLNSTFILKEFKSNIGKGFYGDKELERLVRRLIHELWRRNPALLEDISHLTAKKYGDYVKKTYGTVNFRKKLNQEYNKRQAEKIKRETEQQLLEITGRDGVYSPSSVEKINNDTMFGDGE